MRPVGDGLTIASGGSGDIRAPGGYHLMFVDSPQRAAQAKASRCRSLDLRARRRNLAGPVRRSVGMGATVPAAPAFPEAEKTAAKKHRLFSAMTKASSPIFTLRSCNGQDVSVSPGRAGPVEIAIQLENADELPLTAKAVTVTLGNSESGIAPATV